LVENDEPVERLFTQGMVIKDGAKMSKSLGNVVSPDDMVRRFGADSARLYSLFATTPDRDLDWKDDGIAGIYRFLGKVHRLVARHLHWRETHSVGATGLGRDHSPSELEPEARAVQRKLHQTIRRVTDDFQGRWHFNTSISAIMELENELQSFEEVMMRAASPAHVALLAEVERNLVLLLAPFAPYLAHELWEMLGEKEMLLRVPWPKYDPVLAKEEEIEIPVQINGKLRAVVRVAAGSSADTIRDTAMEDAKIKTAIAGKRIVRIVVVPGKLVNVVVL
jgi:leucyl-tRNA synthetase